MLKTPPLMTQLMKFKTTGMLDIFLQVKLHGESLVFTLRKKTLL